MCRKTDLCLFLEMADLKSHCAFKGAKLAGSLRLRRHCGARMKWRLLGAHSYLNKVFYAIVIFTFITVQATANSQRIISNMKKINQSVNQANPTVRYTLYASLGKLTPYSTTLSISPRSTVTEQQMFRRCVEGEKQKRNVLLTYSSTQGEGWGGSTALTRVTFDERNRTFFAGDLCHVVVTHTALLLMF